MAIVTVGIDLAKNVFERLRRARRGRARQTRIGSPRGGARQADRTHRPPAPRASSVWKPVLDRTTGLVSSPNSVTPFA